MTTKSTIANLPESKLTKDQKKTFAARPIPGREFEAVKVTVRYDDDCGNGHNSFSITGDVYRTDVKGNCVRWISGGCVHEEVAAAFPELAPLIKWHLCSADGPMHYIGNAMYHAGNRDCHGKLAGEAYRFETVVQFGNNPIKHHLKNSFAKFLEDARPHPGRAAYDFEVIGLDHDDRKTYGTKYTFGGFASRWHECPFDTEQEALDFLTALQTCDPKFVKVPTAWGEGKERDLAAARNAAIWPEATDEELTAPDLKERLEARLPALMEQFKAAVESLGLTY